MNTTEDTLLLIKTAMTEQGDLNKSFSQPSTATTGLQQYNLEAPAKVLTPIYTPLRNSIPRVTGGYAIQANWKAITGININNQTSAIEEGKRGGVITHDSADYYAKFVGWGLENSVTFEANYSADRFADLKALAVQQTLMATMVREEFSILGGNATAVAMGTTPTPTLAVAAGGALADATTYRVICVALGLKSYVEAVGINNGSVGQYFNAATTVIKATSSRTNADSSTTTINHSTAQKSVAATILTTAANQKISATVSAVKGAAGYAWYVGVGAGNERLVGVTSINSIVITDAADGAAQLASDLPASDCSKNTLDFDGLVYQALKSGSNAYYKALATGTAGTGSTLTSDGAGGITELNDAFEYFWSRYRLSPTKIYVSAQELKNISSKVIANAGAPLLRQMVGANFEGKIDSGVLVGRVLNKMTNTYVPLETHPNMPAGTMLFYTDMIPYPMSNIANVVQMLMRQDYYQIEWPLRTRQYEYGVYADGVLQNYAPFSLGVITNIANG